MDREVKVMMMPGSNYNEHIDNQYNCFGGTQINHTHKSEAPSETKGSDNVPSDTPQENCTGSQNTSDKESLPACLTTDKAMNYWRQLMEAGFVDEHCQRCKGVSRQIAMYIADCMADALKLPHRWKPFEQLWNINHLAQEKKRMQDTGIRPQRHEEIDKIFNES